jgi:hypothetical protein
MEDHDPSIAEPITYALDGEGGVFVSVAEYEARLRRLGEYLASVEMSGEATSASLLAYKLADELSEIIAQSYTS